MGKNYNYNYVFVFYDVGEKRVNKVFKVCKKYFHHHQNSVFRGPTTPSNLIKFREDLSKVIDKSKDFVSIIKFMNKESFDEETIGIKKKDTESLIF